MENMEINEVVTTDAIREITEAVPNGKSGLKAVAAVGVIGAASVATWEFAVKPLLRNIKSLIVKKAMAEKPKKIESYEDDLDDMDLDDIPEIEE